MISISDLPCLATALELSYLSVSATGAVGLYTAWGVFADFHKNNNNGNNRIIPEWIWLYACRYVIVIFDNVVHGCYSSVQL